jgi:hypothetical protein
MRQYTLDHLSDAVLLCRLSEIVARDRRITADLLAHIAEVDARRLYVPTVSPSMFAYCVEELHMSEGAAYRRIQAARIARKFPILFEELERGRLHLTAVNLLAPHLTQENADDLIAGARHKGKQEIEAWLAVHGLGPCAPARTFSIKPVTPRVVEPAPVHVDPEMFFSSIGRETDEAMHARTAETTVSTMEPALAQVDASTPTEPELYRMQVTIPKGTHDKLRHAQALLSHAVPLGDVAQVLDRALDLLIRRLESRKFGIPGRRHVPERR